MFPQMEEENLFPHFKGTTCFQSQLFYLLNDFCEIWCTYVKSKIKNVLFVDFFLNFSLVLFLLFFFFFFFFFFSFPIFKSIELNNQ